MKPTANLLRLLPFVLILTAFGPATGRAQNSSLDPVVSIRATSTVAEESSYPYRRLAFKGRFTISRTGPTNDAVSVFVHYSGTASAKDYEPLPWLVSIPAGATSFDLDVVAIQDDLAEPIEWLDAELSDCPPITDPPMGIPCRAVNIDPRAASARVFIRDDGITTASVQITSPRNGAQFRPGQIIPIEATAIDLEGAITAVDFYDGERKIGESVLYFFVQPPPGTPIYHQLDFTNAAPGRHLLTVRGLDNAGNNITSPVVVIEVGAALPVVGIEATVPETIEPSPTTRVRPGVFTLHRRGDTNESLRVLVAYRGTATPGRDYAALSNIVVIPAGATTAELLVGAFDDNLVEGDETVIAELVDPSLVNTPRTYDVDSSHALARIVIHDNHTTTGPVVSIVAVDPLARERTNNLGEINPATFVIRRTGETNLPLSVHFVIGGTASNGKDYEEIVSPVIIPAGQRGVALTVIPIDDDQKEYIETVVVKLVPSPEMGPLPSYLIGTPARAAAVILDYDRPRPPCARLPDGLFNLCIRANSNACFRVEATDDLVNWIKLCTVRATNDTAQFVDPDGADLPRRFYRFVPEDCEEP